MTGFHDPPAVEQAPEKMREVGVLKSPHGVSYHIMEAVEQAEPVAWQYRHRDKGEDEWGKWHHGGDAKIKESRKSPMVQSGRYQVRYLSTHPSATDERLREALEKIKEKMSPNISPEKFIHEIARAALGTQEPGE